MSKDAFLFTFGYLAGIAAMAFGIAPRNLDIYSLHIIGWIAVSGAFAAMIGSILKERAEQ